MANTAERVGIGQQIFTPQKRSDECGLVSIGFDVKQLEFYAWLVEHGKEPQIEHTARLSVSRFRSAEARFDSGGDAWKPGA